VFGLFGIASPYSSLPLAFFFFLFWRGLIFRFLLGYLHLSFIIHHYSRSRVWCYVYFIL
jgi:hypothetical protein